MTERKPKDMRPEKDGAFRSRIVGEGDEAPDQLLANPLNWRVHPKEQQDALEGLLKQVGWVQRVIVNKRTGHVVDGHARVALALRRSEPTLPVLYVDLSETEERLVLAAIDPIGGIGYHPSLLPLHRGRDAVRWAVRMRERVTGGSVYRLSNRMDGGDVLAQRHVFIRPDDTAEELWRRDLAPLGVELLASVVARVAAEGYVHGRAQDEALATWEPSIDRPPAFRPDLLMLPAPDDTLDDIIASAGRGIARGARHG